jgi:hypothetical protein
MLTDSVYNFYVGNLHSHTSYSDGKGLPAEAFAYARDVAGLDFLAVTDHHQMLTVEEYEDILLQADLFTENGVYVAIGGQEWTGVDMNHATVWDADSILTSPQGRYDLLYIELASLGLTAAFCHPVPSNFGCFAYSAVGDTAMNAVEVRDLQEEERYFDILKKGWHVGTDGSQDNHGANWGNGHSWTVALACSLTRYEILEATRSHRTYSTLDRNLQMIFRADGHVMGEEFAHVDNIHFSIDVFDPDTGDDFRLLELYQNGLVIMWAEPDTTSHAWEPVITPPNGINYYVLKVFQTDGNLAWSAPIWIDCTTDLPATPRLEWPYDGQIVGTSLPEFTWHASSGAAGYNLEVHEAAGYPMAPPALVVSGITDTVYSAADSLEDDVVYIWKVSASNQSGTSEPSGAFEFLVDADASSVPAAGGPGPAGTMLLRAAPNPFSEGTTVEFTLDGRDCAELAVYDVTGKLVATLFSGVATGPQGVRWNGFDSRGRRVSPGVYIFRLEAGGRQAIRKATLLK